MKSIARNQNVLGSTSNCEVCHLKPWMDSWSIALTTMISAVAAALLDDVTSLSCAENAEKAHTHEVRRQRLIA